MEDTAERIKVEMPQKKWRVKLGISDPDCELPHDTRAEVEVWMPYVGWVFIYETQRGYFDYPEQDHEVRLRISLYSDYYEKCQCNPLTVKEIIIEP